MRRVKSPEGERAERQRHILLNRMRMQDHERRLARYNAQQQERARAMDTQIGRLMEALRAHAQKGQELEAAARRWRPDPRNPGRSLDGSMLDVHPPEHRNRMLKEAHKAIESHAAEGVRVINPLIESAEFEHRNKVQLGTRLQAGEVGEVGLLTQQYQNLTRQQKAELQTLGMAALTRGDLTSALQHKRAAEVLHVDTPDLDSALRVADPVRREGQAQLDKLGKLVDAAKADQARLHTRAGIADGTEQILLIDWAAEHGMDPDTGASFVEAALSAE